MMPLITPSTSHDVYDVQHDIFGHVMTVASV